MLDGWPAVDRDHYTAVVTGAFVRPTALVEPNRAAYLHADSENARILRHAFAPLFVKYGAQDSPDSAKFGAIRLVWNLAELEAKEMSEDDILAAISSMDLRIMPFQDHP